MKRIIITHDEEVSDELAVKSVAAVIEDGRISKGKHGMHYCWLTVFRNVDCGDIYVHTRTKHHPNAADSFHVSNAPLLGMGADLQALAGELSEIQGEPIDISIFANSTEN